MTPDEFAAAWAKIEPAFDEPWHETVRLEVHQKYTVPGEQDALEAFGAGRPRPVWSVRTDPWLARIALTTLDKEHPKRWRRCRLVRHPRTLYTDHEIQGYRESQAAGEEISITPLEASPDLAALRQDFWGFDLGTPAAFVIIMNYDPEGCWLGAERTADPRTLARCMEQWALAMKHSVPLNEYLAPSREAQKAA